MSKTTIFKVAPDYTIAHEYKGSGCVCLEEWTDRTAEDFTRAMGRPADAVTSVHLSRGIITEYVWTSNR